MRRHSLEGTRPSEAMDWERPSERFLAYLDRLAAACVARDRDEVDKLMRMRLSSHVPRAVLDELEFFRRAREANLRAPMKLMRYVHKMKQLATAQSEKDQLPLELRERDVTTPLPPARRVKTGKREEGQGKKTT